MSATKFTQEEMDKIKEIQSSYLGVQQAFGQLEVNRIRLEQQLDSTQQASVDLRDKFSEVQKNEQNFIAMLTLYIKIIECKDLVMEQLDHLETFKTYVQTDMGYKVTNPEGYVLHHNGDMIKLVNRIEFSYINFTLAKSWK